MAVAQEHFSDLAASLTTRRRPPPILPAKALLREGRGKLQASCPPKVSQTSGNGLAGAGSTRASIKTWPMPTISCCATATPWKSPPLLLCCDLDRIVIHTNFTGTVSATYDIPSKAWPNPAILKSCGRSSTIRTPSARAAQVQPSHRMPPGISPKSPPPCVSVDRPRRRRPLP